MGTPYQLHTPETLAELAAKYTNAEMVADEIAPVFESPRKLIKYWKFTRRDFQKITDARIAPDGDPNERKFTATSTEAEVEPYALADKIPLSDLNDPEPGIDLEADTAEDLTSDLQLGHEKRVADLVMDPTQYASANKVTLSGTDQFTDKTNSDPIDVIQTAKRACAMPPNVAICDEVTFDALASHPDIVAFLRGVGGAVNGLASAEELARYFGLARWIVGRAKYDSANAGQTASFSYVWPQGRLLLARTNPTPRAREAILARTLRYRPGGAPGGILMDMWDDRKPGTQGVRWIKGSYEEKVVMVAADCGYLISGAA